MTVSQPASMTSGLISAQEYENLLVHLVTEGKTYGKTTDVAAYKLENMLLQTQTESGLDEVSRAIQVEPVYLCFDQKFWPTEFARKLAVKAFADHYADRVIGHADLKEPDLKTIGVWAVKQSSFNGDYLPKNGDIYTPNPDSRRLMLPVEDTIRIPTSWGEAFTIEKGGMLAIREKSVGELIAKLNEIRDGKVLADTLFKVEGGKPISEYDVYGTMPGFREANYNETPMKDETTAAMHAFAEHMASFNGAAQQVSGSAEDMLLAKVENRLAQLRKETPYWNDKTHPNFEATSRLYAAIKGGHIDDVHKALKDGACINARIDYDRFDTTLLQMEIPYISWDSRSDNLGLKPGVKDALIAAGARSNRDVLGEFAVLHDIQRAIRNQDKVTVDSKGAKKIFDLPGTEDLYRFDDDGKPVLDTGRALRSSTSQNYLLYQENPDIGHNIEACDPDSNTVKLAKAVRENDLESAAWLVNESGDEKPDLNAWRAIDSTEKPTRRYLLDDATSPAMQALLLDHGALKAEHVTQLLDQANEAKAEIPVASVPEAAPTMWQRTLKTLGL